MAVVGAWKGPLAGLLTGVPGVRLRRICRALRSPIPFFGCVFPHSPEYLRTLGSRRPRSDGGLSGLYLHHGRRLADAFVRDGIKRPNRVAELARPARRPRFYARMADLGKSARCWLRPAGPSLSSLLRSAGRRLSLGWMRASRRNGSAAKHPDREPDQVRSLEPCAPTTSRPSAYHSSEPCRPCYPDFDDHRQPIHPVDLRPGMEPRMIGNL